jgi:hypothetical protein
VAYPNDEHTTSRLGQLVKDWAEFAFAAVLTISGVAGYYILRDQLELMWLQTTVTQNQILDAERSERRARQNIDRSLKIAADQSEALKSLAAANTRTLSLHERAHLTVDVGSLPIDPITATHPSMQEMPLLARIVVSNNHFTPARQVQVDALAELLPRRTAPRFKHVPTIIRAGVVTSTAITLRPEFRHANGAKVGPLRQSTITDIQTGSTRLFVYGRLTYTDMLEGCYWRDFCFIYASPPSNTEPIEWLPCQRHNDEGECGK